MFVYDRVCSTYSSELIVSNEQYNICSPPIAQLVERRAYTSVVLGSSPSGRTIYIICECRYDIKYTSVVLGSSPSGWIKK